SSLKQIIKGTARARRSGRRARRAGLAFNRRARRKQRAVVAALLRRDTRGKRRLRAFEPGAGVERYALHAAVDICPAARAALSRLDGKRQQIAAARAAEHLVRGHEVRRPRSRRVLKRPSRRSRLPRIRLVALRRPFARLILISALAIFTIVH